jgi:hypothetical protein
MEAISRTPEYLKIKGAKYHNLHKEDEAYKEKKKLNSKLYYKKKQLQHMLSSINFDQPYNKVIHDMESIGFKQVC